MRNRNALSIEILDGGSFLANFGIRPHAATMIPLRWETTLDQEMLVLEKSS